MTSTEQNREPVTVTQADRDAAADIYRRFRYGATVEIQAKIRREIERGQRDDDPIAQVFARHRIASTPTQPVDGNREERAALVEAAYREGYRDSRLQGGSRYEDSNWNDSRACAALADTERPTERQADGIEAVVAATIERAAKLAETTKYEATTLGSISQDMGGQIAAAIRSLSPTDLIESMTGESDPT